MRDWLKMRKFKFFLLLSFFPLAYIAYYLTSYDSGVNAIIEKQKQLKSEILKKEELRKEIIFLRRKISLLNKENIDLDLLSEKALETLGKADRNSIIINLNNL